MSAWGCNDAIGTRERSAVWLHLAIIFRESNQTEKNDSFYFDLRMQTNVIDKMIKLSLLTCVKVTNLVNFRL